MSKKTKKPPGTPSRSRGFFDGAAEGSGRPFFSLPSSVQTNMETGLGADFSAVKLVTESDAASRLGANAFTQGDTVHFAPGKFSPTSPPGQELIGHELAHVVQQRQGRVRPTLEARGVPINADPSLEAEADRAGRAAVRGGAAAEGPVSPTASVSGGMGPAVIQGDFAIAPTAANPVVAPLTPQQVTDAIAFGQAAFTDADELAEVRDVLGVSPQPAAVDDAFVRSVGRYQSRFGLAQDGQIHGATAGRLADEMEAEAASLGARAEVGTPTKMALAAAARRMRLRAGILRTDGELTHLGFVGDRLRPEATVSVREGDNLGALSDVISLEYSGLGGSTANWLQFFQISIFGFAPGSTTRVDMPGSVPTSGAPAGVPISRPGAGHWDVDSGSAASPFYGAAFASRVVGQSNSIFDLPGGPPANPVVEAFANSRSPALAQVQIDFFFDAYLIRNNQAQYRVRWTSNSTYTIAGGTVTQVISPNFTTGTGENINRLRPAQRTALLARYPGSTIP
ncbi:MAG: DUF4157 domain-containing protein [Acidobacteriota bacterium]